MYIKIKKTNNIHTLNLASRDQSQKSISKIDKNKIKQKLINIVNINKILINTRIISIKTNDHIKKKKITFVINNITSQIQVNKISIQGPDKSIKYKNYNNRKNY